MDNELKFYMLKNTKTMGHREFEKQILPQLQAKFPGLSGVKEV
ncbi:uncharacterized protein RCC_06855 [Ramularia collo-cygni]|uniref:Uncharacterized protein n=1 Tax=Ramularia collo-cygni TaxID=112498 RepID=A0A2D3VDV0_9PEZI|nr:uncharacterized protein RCC_06855 [Ramularia collo-cygni]CZT20994.1 uncharacterized protein RCC_06855 [Ramularia collo-cygni]